MSNTIGIVWTSDSSALFADYNKRIALLETENGKLRERGVAEKQASAAMSDGWRQTSKDIEEIGRRATSATRKRMDAETEFEERMKRLRSLRRKGEIDHDQYIEGRKAYKVDLGAKKEIESLERRNELEREARVLVEATTTAQERHASNMQRFDQMLAEGVITQERYERAVTKSGDAMRKAGITPKQRLAMREAKRLIDDIATAQERHNGNVQRYDRLLKAGLISQDQYTRAVKRSTDALKEVPKNPLAGMLNSVKGLAASWVSVYSAIRLVSAEIQNVKDRQKEAMEVQKPYGEKLFEVAKNYGPINAKTLTELDEKARGISERTGAKPTDVLDTLNTALAGRVGGTVEDALQAAEMATQISRTPEAMGATARAYLTERAAYPDKSIKEIAGEQMVAKQLSPTDTDESFAQHVSPHLANAKQFGNSYSEAAALSAVIARRMADKEGRISTNAFITLESQLNETLPQVKGGTMDRLQALNTPEHAKAKAHLLGSLNSDWDGEAGEGGKLKSHLEGERKAFLTMVSLINNDKDAMAEYKDYLSQMPKNKDEAEKITSGYIDLRTTHPLTRGADMTRRAEADVEREKLTDPKAEASVMRDYIKQKTKAIGDDVISQWVSGFQFETKSGLGQKDAIKSAIDVLDKRAAELEAPTHKGIRGADAMVWDTLLSPFGMQTPKTPALPADVDKARRIRDFTDRDLRPRIAPAAGAPGPRGAPAPQAAPAAAPPPPVVNVNVNVQMPGQGEKAPPVPASGLGSRG